MRIVLAKEVNNTKLGDYFDYNHIQYGLVDLWNADAGTHGHQILDQGLVHSSSTLLVISGIILTQMWSWPASRIALVEFLRNNNKIWIFPDSDSLLSIRSRPYTDYLLEMDQLIPAGAIKIFIDGQLSDRHVLNSLQRVKLVVLPYSIFLHMPRIFNSICDKSQCTRDFMLTMNNVPDRPHRQILFNQLNAIPDLAQRGYIKYGPRGINLIGIQPQHHNANNGRMTFPSMDLYLDSWLEIVPETMHRDGYFVTEKTVKPIATKTPVLFVSTCRYLEYLKQLGFQTFDSIIDESYDRQYLVQDRITLMLAQLQDIIRNGSESFYQACRPILEHNQARLLEISGRRTYDMDVMIRQHLEADGVI